jgi:hypothetical protein
LPFGTLTWLTPGRYKNKNSAAAKRAATARAVSKSQGVRIGLPRRGIHVAFGVGMLTIGRVFIVISYPVFRRPTPSIIGFAGFSGSAPQSTATSCAAPGWPRSRRRDMEIDMALGFRTQELAQKYKVSAGRISQVRREACEDWRRFQGEAA